MTAYLDSEVVASTGDNVTTLLSDSYAFGGDLIAAPVTTTRPSTGGPMTGFRLLEAANLYGPALDLSPFGVKFAGNGPARYAWSGLNVANGQLIVAQDRFIFWYVSAEYDPNVWAAQGNYTEIAVNVTAGSNVATLSQYTPSAADVGRYLQCWPAQLGGTGVASPTVTGLTGVQDVFLSYPPQTDGSFTAWIGDDPSHGYYPTPAALNFADIAAQRIDLLGCTISAAAVAVLASLSSYVTLRGCTITGIARPTFDPLGTTDPYCVDGRGGEITNLAIEDSDITGPIVIADAATAGAVAANVTTVTIDNTWHDQIGLPGLTCIARASTTGPAGVVGELGATGPYIYWDTGPRRVDWFYDPADPTARSSSTMNFMFDDPYVDPCRIEITETNIKEVPARPRGLSPAEQWRNDNPWTSLFDYEGWTRP